MRSYKYGLITAVLFLCMTNVASVFAQSASDRGNSPPGGGWGRGGSVKGAPGPLAGAGLPFLIAAGAFGAYKLIRRRADKGHEQRGEVERHQR
jgi:hypothetical protein